MFGQGKAPRRTLRPNRASHSYTDSPNLEDNGEKSLLLSPISPLSNEEISFYKATIDEQIVNTALIVFLSALTLNCPAVKGSWSLHRAPFVAKDTSGNKLYEARVDGYLINPRGEITAIVEVKPFLREKEKKRTIRIQEGGQMAAWISQYPSHDLEDQRRMNKDMV